MTYTRIHLQVILCAFLSLMAGLIFSTLATKPASAAYDGGYLTSDSVFLDANSMDATAVQNFLSSKGSGLATRNFVLNCYDQSSLERQWYTAVGAPCDQSIPASHIIYYAAKIYGINPKVILATLQKEQSLVTAPNPTDTQISQAMGYACPTTGDCNASSNFFWQIDGGAWALRYHYERAKGNLNWWKPSTSWVCGTEKDLYKPNLYPGQNVHFYDRNGVLYRTHYLSNAATSAFYCYTPHAYNNPQGLSGLPVYGTTGEYFVGHYNFVTVFEQWFGTTTGEPFAARIRAVSPPATVDALHKGTLSFDFQNTGSQFWKDDLSALPYYPRTRLVGTWPINRASGFYDSTTWLSQNRPVSVFTKVFESDGVTLTNDQHTVWPGQVARFQFNVSYPSNGIDAGNYKENFELVQDGATEWWVPGGYAWQAVNVPEPFAAAFSGVSPETNVSPGNDGSLWFEYKNTGARFWKDDISALPYYPRTRLAGSWPINRESVFSHSSWIAKSRPAATFAKVVESDGITPTADQHTVWPGQIARFQFNVSYPASGIASGWYKENFEVVQDGIPNWWVPGSYAWQAINASH